MKRKKTNVNLIAIVLSLIAILTTHAKAATTFYEVWRNTEPNLATAQCITDWPQISSNGTIEFVDAVPESDPNIYYYWVRTFKGTHKTKHVDKTEGFGRIIGDLDLWCATEASQFPIPAGYHGWPSKYSVHANIYSVTWPSFITNIECNLEKIDDSYNIRQWYSDSKSTTTNQIIFDHSDSTQYDDLYSIELSQGSPDSQAEINAISRIWSSKLDLDETIQTDTVVVGFISLQSAPVVTIRRENDQLIMRWYGETDRTTEFSQMVRSPKRIYVHGWRHSGNHDGTNWENAYQYIQDALQEALYGDEIWVTLYGPSGADAVYLPDIDKNTPSTEDRNASFVIPPGVKVYGGFEGDEICLEQRNWQLNETVLSGDIKIYGTENDNCLHVVTITNCDANTLLDGFIIESGFANMPAPNNKGAGIYIENSDATVRNCIVASNAAVMASGIYCKQGSPAIVDCLIRNNYAAIFGGAGLYNENSDTIVINSRFMLNFCDVNETGDGGDGGAVYNQAGSPVMTNCEFKCNTAMRNGGGIYNWNSEPEFINCTFAGNIAEVSGGGMYNDENFPGQVMIKNSVFWVNSDSNSINNEYSQISGYEPVIYNSCIQDEIPDDGILPFSGVVNNNIDSDPGFVTDPNPGPDGQWNTADDCIGDTKLTFGSTCIEAGENSYLPKDTFDVDNDEDTGELIPQDAAGHNRLIDWNRDFIATVDMGAYERGVCPGNPDLDGSGLVNFADFAMFAAKWLDIDCDCHGSCCDGTDLNSDEKVNVDDLAILAANWLGGIESGLVAYYPFDGNNDDIAGGHGGGWNGGSFIAAGVKGQAYSFSNSTYFTANIPEMDNVSQLTVSIWFTGRNTQRIGCETVVCKGKYTESPAFQMWISENKTPDFYNVQINSIGGLYNSTAPYYVDMSAWHHFALTYDGSVIKAYVDGLVVDDLEANIGPINTTGHFLYINRHDWSPSEYSSRLQGQVDEFRIYNRALSDLEIQQLYNLE